MNIQAINNSPSFGIKIPIEDAVEAASARNLFGTRRAFRTQCEVIKKLTNISDETYQNGDTSFAAFKLSNILRSNHPELKKAAQEIDTYCTKNSKVLNATKGDVSKDLVDFVKNIITKIGKKDLDIEPIQPAALGF